MHHNLGSKEVLGGGNTLMRCRKVASYEISFFCKFWHLLKYVFRLLDITRKSSRQVSVFKYIINLLFYFLSKWSAILVGITCRRAQVVGSFPISLEICLHSGVEVGETIRPGVWKNSNKMVNYFYMCYKCLRFRLAMWTNSRSGMQYSPRLAYFSDERTHKAPARET